MTTLLVILIGDSTGLGYAPPLTGTAIPSGQTYVRNGVTQTAYQAYYAGIEDGFLDCTNAAGVDATLAVFAGNGWTTGGGATTVGTPDALAWVAASGETPDLIITSLGTNDAKNEANSKLVSARLFGPYGGTAVLPQLHGAWGQLPTIVVEPFSRTYPRAGYVRADLAIRCERLGWCTRLETQIYSTNDGVHPNSQGFYSAGEDLCGLALGG